jgi:primosomal protein N' (replication factor Y)
MIALDPTPAAVVKVAGKYRYKMLVKARNTKPMRDLVRELMHTLNSDPMARGVTVYVDINPASML